MICKKPQFTYLYPRLHWTLKIFSRTVWLGEIQWFWDFICLHSPACRDYVISIEHSLQSFRKKNKKKNLELLARRNYTDNSNFPIWLKIGLILPLTSQFFEIFWVTLNYTLLHSPCQLASGGIWNPKIIESRLVMVRENF